MDTDWETQARVVEIQPTDINRDLQTLIEEGKQLLEKGDKPRALAHFVMATQLHPHDKDLWLLRAEATDDPHEAADCLERVLEIDPENTFARERMLFVRVHSLQERAREETRITLEGKGGMNANPLTSFRFWFVVFTAFFCAASIFAIVGYALFDQSGGAIASLPTQTPTEIAIIMPPTWTPLPSPTPLPPFTPVPPPVWNITRDVNARTGPSTAYALVRTLKKDEQVSVVGQTKDGKYLQVEMPGTTILAWIPADYVQMSNADRQALPVITAIPTLPPTQRSVTTPVIKLAISPTPSFEFEMYRPVMMVTDCNRQTGVLGMVYNSRSNAQPLNGVLVRITAFGQVQNIVTTGVKGQAGYWEWYFANGMDIIGEVMLVNPDGSPRSPSVSFRLTQCNRGANQTAIDFVGTR